MITKAPSAGDGKPVGTPTNAVSAWQAGVTVGPDQIERDEAARKARNRAVKLSEKAKRKARRKAEWESQQRGDADWWAYKRRRKRAMEMSRSLAKGRSIAWCAKVHGISEEQVFEELKWRDARQQRRYGKRRESPQAVPAVEPVVGTSLSDHAREQEPPRQPGQPKEST